MSLPDNRRPIDKILHVLLANAVRDGLAYVKQTTETDTPIGPYDNWLKLMWADNGLPYFVTDEGPPDYRTMFCPSSGLLDAAIARELFEPVLAYARTVPKLRTCFESREPSDEQGERIRSGSTAPPNQVDPFDAVVIGQIGMLIDRYIHVHGNTDFAPAQFLEIYLPFEKGIFAERLAVDLVVPILGVRFDFDNLRIGKNLSIWRMDDDLQLARMSGEFLGKGIHALTVEPATHALVLSDVHMVNEDQLRAEFDSSDAGTQDIAEVLRNFITALTVQAGHITGCAQLIIRPLDWAHYYRAKLPSIEGKSVHQYPLRSDYTKGNAAPIVDLGVAIEVGRVFAQLRTCDDERLQLACRRLNMCYRYGIDKDSILDVVLGMEAILSDGGQGGQHIVTLRLAFLVTQWSTEKYTPSTITYSIRQIYKYRSAVLMGDSGDPDRWMVAFYGRNVALVDLGIAYLSIAIRVLLAQPDYRRMVDVDDALLVGKL